MQKCLQINPFEQKFREANRRINFGPDDGLEPPKINLLGSCKAENYEYDSKCFSDGLHAVHHNLPAAIPKHFL